MSKTAFVTARDQSIPVESWDTHVPGLIVTAVPVTEMESGYRITHRDSGYAIAVQAFPSIDVAIVFAEQAKDVLDWTMDKKTFEGLGGEDRETARQKLKGIAENMETDLNNDPSKVLRRAMELKQEHNLNESDLDDSNPA